MALKLSTAKQLLWEVRWVDAWLSDQTHRFWSERARELEAVHLTAWRIKTEWAKISNRAIRLLSSGSLHEATARALLAKARAFRAKYSR